MERSGPREMEGTVTDMDSLMDTYRPVKSHRGRPSADDSPMGEINSQGYEVVGAMSSQLGDLVDIADVNCLEDQARATLGSILREQERVVLRLGAAGSIALELNRRAQRKLALVDVLDAQQGLDTHEPVTRARERNREAHAAGRRIIKLSEHQGTGPDLGVVA